MRILIIGLDGLPCQVGKKIFSGSLKYVGCHFVNTKSLWTPVVWAQLFLAENPENVGWTYERARVELSTSILPKWYAIPYKFLRRFFLKNIGIRKYLIRIGILKLKDSPKVNLPAKLLKASWVAKFRKSEILCIDFPPVCEETNEVYRELITRELTPPEVKMLIKELVEITQQRFKHAAQGLTTNKRLVLVYTPLPDIAYHAICWYKLYHDDPKSYEILLESIYTALKHYVHDLMRIATEKRYHILLVSDHGFDLNSCEHDRLGFWGSTIDLRECDTLACIGKRLAMLINKS